MDRKKQLEAYVRAGMGNAAIAEALGISEPGVGHLVKRYGLTGLRRPGARRKTETGVEVPELEPEPEKPAGHNADRHLCKTCRFRPRRELKVKGFGCNYIGDTNHSRGCKVENCDKYEKGNPKKGSPEDFKGFRDYTILNGNYLHER